MVQRAPEFEKVKLVMSLEPGDKVKLTDGSIAEFVKMKQKNFNGIIDGQSFNIPINMAVEVVEKVDKDAQLGEIATLKNGDPFYINKNGNALLFIFEKMEAGRIIGINPASKSRTKIDKSLYGGKVSDL